MKLVALLLLMAGFSIAFVAAKTDPGKTYRNLNADCNVYRKQWPLLANSEISVKIECDNHEKEPLDVTIFWTLTLRSCWWEAAAFQDECSDRILLETTNNSEPMKRSTKITTECSNHLLIVLPKYNDDKSTASMKALLPKEQKHPLEGNRQPIVVVEEDGIYDLAIVIEPARPKAEFSARFAFETRGPHGYISAVDWPLLPFYGIMCVVYVIFGIIWLLVSFMQWRDLLRIQFWIGGVILLGMLEKAFFYAEYQSLNNSGVPVVSAELVAEFVSSAKRTLARMLVIIMSLGFGIVKPRLGSMLHRVVGVGTLYFVLACVESYLRVMRSKTDERNELMVASIPLAVLDTGICWWIFTSLVQTTRTLRLRRNMVKLALYRHFTNTLIFAVFASVIFMLFAMRMRKSENCTPVRWHDIWIDTAFWHILFSVLLLAIMILWRPTNNNQRYAFTPLLDNPEDEDDTEEEQFVSDAYGVKMRNTHMNGGTKATQIRGQASTTEEDDLRWVEENIPSSMADSALPVLDSDEEIINTKFEVSKMQ